MREQNELSLIINELQNVLERIEEDEIEQLVNAIVIADKVFVTGVGRVLLSMKSGVKRLNHLGVKTFYIGQIDEPAATKDDLLIVASNSGESIIPVAIANKAEKQDVKIAYIGGSRNSTCAKVADLKLIIPTENKLNSDGISSKQPMTTLFEQCLLLICDMLAMKIIKTKNIDIDALWETHANLE